MPNFRYEFRRGQAVDFAEVDLPDKLSAWKEAIRACAETLREFDADFANGDEMVLTVQDENGAPVGLIKCRTG